MKPAELVKPVPLASHAQQLGSPQFDLRLNLFDKNDPEASVEPDKQGGSGKFSPISSPKLEAAMNRLYQNIERELKGL